MAQVPNHYEINISQNGKFHCRIEEMKYWNETDAITFLKDVRKRFPESEGFKCTLQKVKCQCITYEV